MGGVVNTVRRAAQNPVGAIGGLVGTGMGGLGLGGSLGAGLGSVVGGAAGSLGGAAVGNALGIKAPGQQQAAPGSPSAYGEFIQNMAMGRGPSVAQTQMQQGLGQALAQAQAQAASARGVSPALAARMAQQSQAQMSQQANIGAAMMRSQEQMNAAGMWGNYLTGQQNMALSRDQMQAQKDIAHSQQNTQLLGGLLGAGGAALGMMKYDGGLIPGRPAVNGNSPKNDTVPAMLSPGEIVLPLSVVNHPDAGEKAREFVDSLKSRKRMYRGGRCG